MTVGSAADLVFQPAAQMAREIAAGNLSARELVEAHIARLESIQPQINALTVALFEQARAAARALDERQARGERLGALHGVPVTVKECFYVAGTPSTMGIDRFADERLDRDAALVTTLRSAGAIIIGKTNVPQLMTLYETVNPVYGRTNNPWRLDRNAGGSSGGEAAVIAAGGSALGLASDLGGSIRQPAHCCGIAGYKPSAGLLVSSGSRTAFRGMEAVAITPGLLARTTGDVRLGMQVLTGTDVFGHGASLDDADHPAAEEAIEGVRIGYFASDGYFEPSPAIRRAVDEAARLLGERGATVERWQPPDAARAVHLYWQIVSADGGADFRRWLARSRRDRRVKRLLQLIGLPGWLRPPLSKLLTAVGQRGLAELIEFTGPVSADAYWRLTAECAEYCRQFKAAMDRSRVDVLIGPVYGLPAPLHGKSLYVLGAAGYCQLVNLLGLPAGVVAATRVRASEETARGASSRDKVERAAYEIELGSAGLPVGVQVFGRLGSDRLVLDVMETLETAFRASSDYPSRPPL